MTITTKRAEYDDALHPGLLQRALAANEHLRADNKKLFDALQLCLNHIYALGSDDEMLIDPAVIKNAKAVLKETKPAGMRAFTVHEVVGIGVINPSDEVVPPEPSQPKPPQTFCPVCGRPSTPWGCLYCGGEG